MSGFVQGSPPRAAFILSIALLCAALAACDRADHVRSSQPAAATVPASPPAVRYEAHLEAGGNPPPGATPHNPHANDPGAAKAGALLFTAMNCDGCHGGDAVGWVGPSLSDGRWRYGGSDGEVFSSIYFGRPKGMPAFGGELGEQGVWNLVSYIRSLPLPPDVPTESFEDKK